MKLDFDFHGDVQISRELLRHAGDAQDVRPAFRAIARYMASESRKQFDSQGGHASGGWASLKEATIRYKKSRGLDNRILHATGALRESLTKYMGPDQRLIITAAFMVFGSEVEYMKYHQTGTSTMPRRRPVEFRAAARVEIVKKLQRFLVTGQVK